jgi:preprotein translocase subunit Sss1
MVKVVGIEIRAKKERKDPLFNDEKFIGEEPKWDTETAKHLEDAEFEILLRRSFNYYNYFYNSKDAWKDVVVWLKKNTTFTDIQIKTFTKADPRQFPMTACSLVLATKVGMPIREKHAKFIINEAQKLINKTKMEVEVTAPAVPTPNIQERIAEKTSPIIAEIEGDVDLVFQGKAPVLNILDFLTANSVPQIQIGKMREKFNRQLTEVSKAVSGKCPELAEAYSYLVGNKKLLSNIVNFYKKLMTDLDAYAQVKKNTRKPRTKKLPSKEKITAKVKFMKESKELKIVSVNPVNILNAKAVWVYNSKYRKIGRYEAAEGSTLSIKGTTIINYDEVKSVAKTLRKPAEQLKEFMKSGKVALRTFLKNIHAVESRLNGRLSEDVLILKVE